MSEITIKSETRTAYGIHINLYKWYVIFEPTGNCQLASFINFLEFCELTSTLDFYSALSKFFKQSQKPILLVDLKLTSETYDKAIERLEDYIMNSMTYSSTNGSTMCIHLINIKRIYEHFEAKKFG